LASGHPRDLSPPALAELVEPPLNDELFTLIQAETAAASGSKT